MTQRIRWTCPQCDVTYAVPSTKGLTLCPRCEADNEPPLINMTPKRASVKVPRIVSFTGFVVCMVILAFLGAAIFAQPSTGEQLAMCFWTVLFLGVFLAIGILYFLPSIIAHQRAHRNFAPILILNFAFAWTFVGWVLLMVWATLATIKVETERTI